VKLRAEVRGVDLDPQTRCAHWRSPRDVIAIKMKCCGEYYACWDCHDALAGHPAEVWQRAQFDEKAVLCGACGEEMSIQEYLNCADACPRCGAGFNPGCKLHHHSYFEVQALQPSP
jgi:uncharacterized CHY-type Zn-finger protein